MRAGALTRADIARELRLSRSNLSPVILGLVADRLLVSVGRDESRGGRRGDLLGVAGAESAVVAGVEIDVNRIRVLLATLGLEAVATRLEAVETTADPARTLELAAALITDSLDPSCGPLIGVGLSLPAAIDADRGVPAVAPAMPQWVDFPVVDRLAELLSTRVFMDSDLNALALAEMTVRHHPPLGPAFLVVKAHEGVGCGIVINNSVFRGSQGSAGEMGHICVDPDDATICACGHRGCLEAVVSPANLAVRARELARTERSPALGPLLAEPELTMDAIGQAVLEGDPVAASLMRELGMRIGFVLAGAISFFNPSSIVISTARMLGSQVLLGAIRHGVYERAFAGATRRLQIVESGLGDDAVAVGAAALARDGFLGTAGRVASSRGVAQPVVIG
ncbi:MAG TPA: ROK family protein [Gaiellaceae bacterium]|nr:ROK family protein [Gaiellaceae bacterium]